MKNLRKLVIASFMLVIAFVAVVSSTYAWFTLGGEVKVNDITVGVVESSKTMLVSKDGSAWGKTVALNYKGKLTPATADVFSGNNLSFKQIAVGDQGGSLVPIDALLESDTAPTAPTAVQKPTGWVDNESTQAIEEANNQLEGAEAYRTYLAALAEYNAKVLGGYIKFDLYFQVSVNSEDDWSGTYIDMDLDALHAYNVTTTTENNVETTTEDTSEENQYAISSFRLAVVEHKQNSAASELQPFVEDQHEVNNIGGGRYGSGAQFAATNKWMQIYAAGNLVVAGSEENDPYTLAASCDRLGTEQSAGIYYNTVAVGDNHEYTLTCNETNIYEAVDATTRIFHITVYAWMEGWDGDNINAASGVNYHFNLTFKTR